MAAFGASRYGIISLRGRQLKGEKETPALGKKKSEHVVNIGCHDGGPERVKGHNSLAGQTT